MNHKEEIVKILDAVYSTSAYSPHDVFEDWLSISLATLESIPGHIKAAEEGTTYIDTPETLELFGRVNRRYGDNGLHMFSKALAILIGSTAEYQDVLGNVYMRFGNPNPSSGQFFTPWDVAVFMARMSAASIEDAIHHRIKTAIERSPNGIAMLLAGGLSQDKESWYFDQLLPVVAQWIEPVTIFDPCCGSGIMLIAAASQIPSWAIQRGIVKFYGADIDHTCVMMARINCIIYGLGYSVKAATSLSDEEILSMPQPYQEAYAEAKVAEQLGNRHAVEEISRMVRIFSQQSLFDI